jgi:hypothetical protein
MVPLSPQTMMGVSLVSFLLRHGGIRIIQTVGPSGHTNSPHPSSREGHHYTGSLKFEFPLLSRSILRGSHAA